MTQVFVKGYERWKKDKKIICDIYYSPCDVTTLRWLSEVNAKIDPFQKYVTTNTYPIKSKKAHQLFIQKDTIMINDEKVNTYDVARILKEKIEEIINMS
ncbi:MAG: hypothetical protein ACXAC7_13160 [Candidatus Hodarchaeales archaeon]